MPMDELIESLVTIAYRLSSYMVNHVMDDPAMLAIVFC